MGTFTQQQFLDAVEREGMRDWFSEADWYNSLMDPDFGMTTLSNKMDWRDAKTPEARKLANLNQENNRRSKGYTGGSDGSKYYQVATPASYNYESAPSFESSVTGDKEDLWNQLKNYGDFSYASAPEYSNRYDDRIQGQIGRIENYGPFAYDAATDPLYSQYRKQYVREGRRATEDMLASASAASGGMPSSYAYTAAAQQGNYYASQLTDKIPELYQLAYNKYLSDFQLENSKLSALQGAEQADRALWQAQLNQYNTDRNFDYGVYSDKYNRIYNNYNTALNQENTDWSRYLDQVTQHNIEQNFKYNQWMDELAKQQQEQQDKWNQAAIAHDIGDNSFYNDLGVNTDNDPAAQERKQQEIATAINVWASTGDASMLETLGISTANDPAAIDRWIKEVQNALDVYDSTGDESLLAALGITPNLATLNSIRQALGGVYEGGGGGYSGGGDTGGDGVDYSGYLDAPSADSDFNPYDNAGTVAGSGNLVTGSSYTGSGKQQQNTTQPTATQTTPQTGNKTGNKSGSKTGNASAAQTTKKANENEASTADMVQFTTSITAMAASGRSNSEIRSVIDEAYSEGLISSAQRDKLKANFPVSSSSGSGSSGSGTSTAKSGSVNTKSSKGKTTK